ncbi:MAG: 30S ribosomal protein S6 [Candidatus Peregrinibacteria bacterium]|nr:30S ribosomal protein S6 [Candidatus Peregrinibacteria bacterium]MDZ4244428.1 30S ribosomal protein S6 [Candidatus Gracilibacteria bacterium]
MTTYELMVILPGDMTEREALKHLEEVKGYVKENGGRIKEELIWGKRDMAYTIKKNDVGFYAIYHFTMEGRTGMHELKNELRLDQKVLRDLIIKVPARYTFAEFEGMAMEATKAKEAAMEKRKKPVAPVRKPGGKTDEKVTDAPSAEKKEVKSKKKSTSDTVLDDPDLAL